MGLSRSHTLPLHRPEPSSRCTFIYSKLSTGEFRTLYLFPGASNHPLVGQLEKSTLQRHVPYQAVSYVWGSPKLERLLNTPSGAIPITESLFTALVNFRSTTQPVRLWADAVCINQASDVEKAQQISMMGVIYRQASEVLVFLGPSAPSDPLAFWALNIFADFYCRSNRGDVPLGRSRLENHAWRKNREALMRDKLKARRSCGRRSWRCKCCLQPFEWPAGDFDDAVFRAFLRICQRPWWTRLWTIQEVALADKAVFYVGQHHALLGTLSDAIGGWYETYGMVQGDISVREEHYAAASHAYRVIHGLIMFFRDDSECCPRQRFLQHLLLPSCDNISTTVPADIVYATRKLTLAWKEPSLDPTRRLKDSDLWKEVTLSLLADREGATLPAATILALVGTQHPSHTFPTQPYRDPSLPSWVCDIKACTAEAWRKFAFYRPDTHKPCAGGPDPQMEIAYSGEQLDMLCVCGHRWARIHHILESSQRFSEVYVSGYFEKPQVEEELRKYVLPWYLRCRRYAFRQRTVYEDLNATFVELLSHGRLFDTSLVRHEEWRAKVQAALEDIYRSWPVYMRVDVDLDQVITELAPFLDEELKRRPFDSSRVLAYTENGHLAWVPEVALAGDWVCLFKGAPYPFILRDAPGQEGCLCLIGDAYVHGISRGEAWPAEEESTELLLLI